MLDGLDDLDWAALSHAYGDAATIPDGISNLARGENVVEWLASSINHQGSVYTATVAAIPFLIEVLELLPDPDPSVRARYGDDPKMDLIGLLRGIGEAQAPTEHRREIYRRIDPGFDDDTYERNAQLERDIVDAVHTTMASFVDRFLALLDRSPNHQVRAGLAYVLATCTVDADRLVPLLGTRASEERDPELRAGLLAALTELVGGWESDAQASLAGRLEQSAMHDESALVRSVAVQAYRHLRDDGSERFDAARVARDVADSVDEWERLVWSHEDAWRDRSSMLPRRADQIRIIRASLRQASSDSINEANHAHGTWRDVGPDLIGDVAALCTAGDWRLRWMAASSIGGWGEGGRVAVDALAELSRDQDALAHAWVGPAAVLGLCRFADERSIPTVRTSIVGGHLHVLRSALPALGPFAADLLPDLAPASHGAEHLAVAAGRGAETPAWMLEAIRAEALLFIGRCGDAAVDHLDDLVQELDGPDRLHAWNALAALGPIASTALPAIERWLPAGELVDEWPCAASFAWLRLGGDPDRILPHLDAILDHTVYGHQVAATLGPLALPALPRLEAALDAAEHPSRYVARAVWCISGSPDRYVPLLVRDAGWAMYAVECVQGLEALGADAVGAREKLHELVDGDVRPFAPGAGQPTTATAIWDDEAIVAAGRRTLAAIEAVHG